MDSLKAKVGALLKSQKFAVLATGRDGEPYGSLVTFAVAEDLKVLYFPTRLDTQKCRNLLAQPRVALVVDNRSNAESDLDQAMAVTVIGEAAVLEGERKGAALGIFSDRHPYLAEFAADPACALVQVRVDRCVVVSQFEAVAQFVP